MNRDSRTSGSRRGDSSRRSNPSILAAIAFVLSAACTQPTKVDGGRASELPRIEFEEYAVVTGISERPTVTSGHVLTSSEPDPVANLVVVDAGGPSEPHRLRVYAFEGTRWDLRLVTTLRPEVQFVDVARIGGRDRLIAYEPGRLVALDVEAPSEEELLSVTSSFRPPRENEVPHVDVTHDVNGDGLEDLVLPGLGSFLVCVQREDGTFVPPVHAGPRPDLSRILGADGYRYDPWSESRIHSVDFDLDGRRDLVSWSDGRFEVFLQDERGRFASEVRTFTTEVSLDSDSLTTFAGRGDAREIRGRVLDSFSDFNGDGVTDLVVYTLEGGRPSKKSSRYEVHLGARSPGGELSFGAEVGLEFETKDRVQLDLERLDFDGDGDLDAVVTTVHVRFLESSLWKRLKGAMGDDVLLELELYRCDGGRFRSEPDAVRTVALDGPPSHREPGSVPLDLLLRGGRHVERGTQRSWPRAFNTTVRFGDLTGDGLTDLLYTDHPRTFSVSPGVRERSVFARHQTISVVPPNDEEYTWLTDLDGDGRQDVVMHHPFTAKDPHGKRERPPGSEPHRVVVLLAR